MKINTVKSKQVKSGVYVLHHGGEVVVANCRYTLPPQSVVIPSNNTVLVRTHRGSYAWQYISHQKVWRIWQLSSVERIEKAIKTVNSVNYDMIVEKDEGGKALMRILTNQGGKAIYKKEWRYYTRFFYDLVRKEKNKY